MGRHAEPVVHSASISKRGVVIAMVTAILAAMLPGVFFSAAQAYSPPGNKMQFTLEACRTDGTVALPNADGNFVCPDPAPVGGNDNLYTTGNLGKSWNELDLVPHRLISSNADSSSTTFNVIVAADYRNGAGTALGYDVITDPQVIQPSKANALSDSSCTVSAGPQTITGAVTGGASEVIYRELTISQDANTTCVIDWANRLALGASKFSGSSLQSYMFELSDFKTGKRTLSIPVNEILPQELRKTMTASQGSNHTWNITKESTPAELNLGNTCDVVGDYVEGNITVKVTWTKNPADPNGPVTIITNIYAKNPAARTITVNATDKIYAGSTQTTLLATYNTGNVDVPANTEKLIGTHKYVWTTPTGTTVNDVATATYTDKVTGVAIPGQTEAKASATIQNNGPVTNQTATITDTESITGNGLQFKVATPASGAFYSSDPNVAAYTAGTWTTGPVEWKIENVSDSGSVTFNKTVRAAKGTIEPNGKLFDTATLTGSDKFSASDEASSSIAVDTKASLKIEKSIPNVLQTGETASFSFQILKGGNLVDTKTLNFAAGDTSKSVTVTGLAPAQYTVHEVDQAKWIESADVIVDLTGAKCVGTAEFTNDLSPANARVKKVTSPTGFEAGWTFSLYKGQALVDTETTTGTGYVTFSDVNGPIQLDEGTYTIVEQGKDGWTSDGGSAECSFKVDFPADAGRTYSCTYTNTTTPDFTITKTCTTKTIPAGETAIFRVEVKNTGVVPLQMLLDDSIALSGGVNGNFAAAIGSDVADGDLTFDGGNVKFTLAAGKTGLFNVSIVATGTSVENSITGTATIKTDASFSKTLDARDKCDVQGGATRTIGFWRTHLSFVEQVLQTSTSLPTSAVIGSQPLDPDSDGAFNEGAYIDLGCFKVTSVDDVMGVFWADTSFDSFGKKRTALCQAKVITSKQLLGAILNQSFSNAAPLPQYDGKDLITATVAALKTDDKTLIKTLGQLLDDYNNSGDDVTANIPGSLTIGKATPQAAKNSANTAVANCPK